MPGNVLWKPTGYFSEVSCHTNSSFYVRNFVLPSTIAHSPTWPSPRVRCILVRGLIFVVISRNRLLQESVHAFSVSNAVDLLFKLQVIMVAAAGHLKPLPKSLRPLKASQPILPLSCHGKQSAGFLLDDRPWAFRRENIMQIGGCVAKYLERLSPEERSCSWKRVKSHVDDLEARRVAITTNAATTTTHSDDDPRDSSNGGNTPHADDRLPARECEGDHAGSI